MKLDQADRLDRRNSFACSLVGRLTMSWSADDRRQHDDLECGREGMGFSALISREHLAPALPRQVEVEQNPGLGVGDPTRVLWPTLRSTRERFECRPPPRSKVVAEACCRAGPSLVQLSDVARVVLDQQDFDRFAIARQSRSGLPPCAAWQREPERSSRRRPGCRPSTQMRRRGAGHDRSLADRRGRCRVPGNAAARAVAGDVMKQHEKSDRRTAGRCEMAVVGGR
jgi:hypothetical protein